jgi:hypothetical protein
MKSSTYLTWLRRLIVLGAVVAGTVASTAGAVVSRPPDVRDAAGSIAQAYLGSPPDVRDVAGTANLAGPDVFERYATAHPYGSELSPALQSTLVSRPPDVGDAANAARSTVVDRIIAQERGRQADLGLFSLGLTSPTSSTLISRPPDVSDAAQAAGRVSFTQSTGFDWGDYAIGIGSGIGLALILAAGLGMSLQRRHRMLTAS